MTENKIDITHENKSALNWSLQHFIGDNKIFDLQLIFDTELKILAKDDNNGDTLMESNSIFEINLEHKSFVYQSICQFVFKRLKTEN